MPTTHRILGLEQKTKQQKMKRKGNGGGSKMITDERFASVQSDPRFVEAPKRHSKVTIDSRFQGIFTDPNFTSSRAPVDKRGKPKTDNASTSITHYYRLDQQENDQQVDVDSRAQVHQIGNQNESESESESECETEGDDVDVDGQSVDESSTTDSDDNYVGEEEEEDTFMLQEDNVPEIDKETRRLAIVNLDWSQVRAVDLYVLLTSFLPKEGKILSVSVYPSEFGLKRMEEEAIRGPVGLFDDEDEHDDMDDDEIDQKKLCAYELSRLRYYYAIVECDSVATSDYLYKTCDGVEFERSSNKLDLRFIPDSMDFKHQPRDVATEAPVGYEGLDFQTRALQHSNIHLTWDEDEPQRAKTLKRKLNDEQIAEMELKEYLASDESESDGDNDDDRVEDESEKKCKKRDKYRALIQSGDDSNEDKDNDNGQDMDVTFSSGLEEISKRIIEKKNKKSETTWETSLRKQKERNKASKNRAKYRSDDESSDTDQDPAEQPDDFFVEDAPAVGNKGSSVQRKKANKSSLETVQETEASRAELELLTADDKWEDSNLKGYNLKQKKRKGKKGEAIPDEGKLPAVDIKEDPRFSALFTSSLYARDPTDPEFKRSAPYHTGQNTKKQQGGPLTSSVLYRALSQPLDKEIDPFQPGNRSIESLHVESTGIIDHEVERKVEGLSEVNGLDNNAADNDIPNVESLRDSSTSYEISTPKGSDTVRIESSTCTKSLDENKKLDSPVIPVDFLCPISLELMRDPVIVATGQTYERSYIQRWIDCGNTTCPKTQQKLRHLTLTPNYVLRSLISQWCLNHNVEQITSLMNGRIKKSDGSFRDVTGDIAAIEALVHKLSSRSLEERRAAVAEIRSLSKRSTDNRILLAEAGAIPILVSLLTSEDAQIQDNAVTCILNLSIYDNNKVLIMLANAIPSIVQVLRAGSMEAKENAAATLFSLSLADENKIIIGASGAIPALVDLLQNGSPRGKKDAATALFNLCIYHGNKGRAVRAGIITALLKMLTDSSSCMVDEALTILSVLASHQEAKATIVKASTIPVLIDLLRTGLPRNKENASAILLSLCKRDNENLASLSRLGAVIPLSELAKTGTERAKRKANSLLETLRKSQQL